MVSVSCFEVILCESYVRFCRVVVFACDGGLVNTDGCRQFPASGHAFFCRRLHVLLLMIAAAAVLSTCIDAVRMRLLWLSIICFVLVMQL